VIGLQVLIDGARDHVEIELLGAPRPLEHEEGEAFRRRIREPFVDGEPVALRLRDLLAVLVQEQLVHVVLGCSSAQHLADFAVDRRVGLVILSEHLEVDAERRARRSPT
jgi:hypothetical protein